MSTATTRVVRSSCVLTVLSVLARRGEWVQVGLSPELRKTGIVMRWYKNEHNGWIHDSMLDVLKLGET